MSHKLSLSNKSYLATTTIVSTGVLSGCEYCIPVLMTLLAIPVTRFLARELSGAVVSLRACP